MTKLTIGIVCLFLAVTSIGTFAAEEVVIPGYSPPQPLPSSAATNSPLAQEALQKMNMAGAAAANASSTDKAPSTPESRYKSCQPFIPITMPYEVVQQNLRKYDETDSGKTYSWSIDTGQPDLIITFLDNAILDVKGPLPSNLDNAKDLKFTLADVQKATNNPGKFIGGVHVFS